MTIKTFIRKIIKRIRGGVITLHPNSKPIGRVLLSYKTEPFLEFEEKEHTHTNIWECREIAFTFLRLGYIVDVIDWYNHQFKPKYEYKYFIDIHFNMNRIGHLLGNRCIKVFHATTSHWLYNNNAEYKRLTELKERRSAMLLPRRTLSPTCNIEKADFVTILGNQATEDTYLYAKKDLHRIPLSTTHTYPFPDKKNIETAKKNFVWIGGVGMVHKGLDLVLEAFVKLPSYKLFVCGDINAEKDFEDLYFKELYKTNNIKTLGKIDMGGEIFSSIANNTIAIIYPSCSEGQAGSVIISMHAGLIPVVSYHSGIDVNDFGIILESDTIEEIIKTVKSIASMSDEELKKRSRKTWEYARTNHTRDRFSQEYEKFVRMLEII